MGRNLPIHHLQELLREAGRSARGFTRGYKARNNGNV